MTTRIHIKATADATAIEDWELDVSPEVLERLRSGELDKDDVLDLMSEEASGVEFVTVETATDNETNREIISWREG